MIPAYIAAASLKKSRNTDNHVGAHVGVIKVHAGKCRKPKPGKKLETLGGGGSAPSYQQGNPYDDAGAQIQLEEAKARIAREQAEYQKKIAQDEYNRKVQKASGLQANALEQALGYGTNQIGARGYDQGLTDKYNLGGLYTDAINQQSKGIAEDDTNPYAKYNTQTAFNDALSQALGLYRGNTTSAINNITGDKFSHNYFGDATDDPYLEQILGGQKNDAMTTIDAAYKRGQLNDQGYERAKAELNSQYSSGMADLQGIGMGVLNGYRDNLNKTKEDALKYAGNLNFDTNYDTSKYQQDIMNMVNQYQGSMQNDLNLASAGHNFFDVNSLLGKAGSLQGYNNSPQTNPAGGAGQTNPLANLTDNKDNLLTSNNSNLIF